jgi:hypothetical protein
VRVRGGRILPILVARALLVRVARDSMTRRGWISIGALATLSAYSACAFPEFQFDDEDGDGGAAGMSSMSSSSATSGSGGGMIGCTLGVIGACGEGQKCTIVDIEAGAIGCGIAGAKPPWDKCNTDPDCADGTWCDLWLGACKPFCVSAESCVFDSMQGECVVAKRSDGVTSIPGPDAKHCTSDCEPRSAAPCLSGVTCIYTGADGGFDCAKSDGVAIWQDCTADPQCAAGLVCDTGRGLCAPWCTPPGTNPACPDFNTCLETTPEVYWQNQEYGFCL